MSPLLGPILAQLVTLGVADRSEARYVVSDENYAEVATYPRVGLNVGWKQTTLTLGYAPSLTLTPLEAKNPSLILFHSAVAALSNRWQRTTLSVSEAVGFGRIDFRDQALGDPRAAPTTTAPIDTPGMPTGTTPGGTNTPGGATGGTTGGTTGTGAQPTTGALANQFRGSDRIVGFFSSVTAVNVTQLVSAVVTVSGGVSYMIAGGDAEVYPTVKGPGARLAATYLPTHHDSVSTSLSSQLAESANGNDAWLLSANETWVHQFSKSTASSLGAGLSLTRNSQPDGLIYYSIYPNFAAGINNMSLIGRNTVIFGASIASAPFIDPVLALVDPRLSAGAFAGLKRGSFGASVTASTAVSLETHGEDNGAFNAINGGASLSYLLATGFSVDGGVRESWQTFAGQNTIPLSWAAYVGVTIGAQVPLSGAH